MSPVEPLVMDVCKLGHADGFNDDTSSSDGNSFVTSINFKHHVAHL